jgi:hypothetical protein
MSLRGAFAATPVLSLSKGSNPLFREETSSPLGIAYPTGTMSQRTLATPPKAGGAGVAPKADAAAECFG